MHTWCQDITFLLTVQDLVLLDKIILLARELLDFIVVFGSIAIELHLQLHGICLLVLQLFF